jgi:hypothetical protein
MVYKLTLSSIFSRPLCTQTLSFFGLAHRTISLFPIFTIKLMSILTMSLSSIYRTYVSGIQIIFCYRYSSKMSRSNTISIATNMVYNKSLRYVPIKSIVRHPMSSSQFTPEKESTVSVFIERTCPQLTIPALYPFTVKPFGFFCCKSTHSTMFTFNTLNYIL